MTFQKHELFGNKPLLNMIAIASGLGVAAAMLVGAGSNARTFGSIQCTGMSQEYIEPGTPVNQVVETLASQFGVDAREYQAIFLQDNRGTANTFVEDDTRTLVIGNGVVNIAESCS